MKNENKSYLEKTAKFLQDINVGKKVLLVLSITFALVLPLVFIEDMNPTIDKVLFVFAVISAFASGIAVFAYIMYFLFLKKYLDTAGTVIDATGTAIDTVAKVKDVHKLIKASDFTKVKEVISKVKDFKMPKLEIKKPDFKSLGDSVKGWFKKKEKNGKGGKIMHLGDVWILVLEIVVLLLVHFYALKKLIPSYFGNKNKELQEENIKKAEKGLYLFTSSVLLYMVLEFFGFKAYLLHIVAAVVVMLFASNMIRPFTLQKWGKESSRLEEVTDEILFSKLFELKEEGKRKVEYEGNVYLYRGDTNKFSRQIPVKTPTSKSEFWAGFFAVMIWAFLVLNLVYILKVEVGAPEILVTLLAFIIAYVLSPFYPDLYTTFVFAQDEEVGFDKFVKVEVNGKEYFGSIEKLTFFKIAIKDYYNDTLVTFFHKLFLNGVMTSYPNGRFIEKQYVVSTPEEQKQLVESLTELLESYREKVKDTFDKAIITLFDHNYGYGVKLRIKVKADKLKEYGGLKDKLVSYIVEKTAEENIDLRTPVLEVGMKEK